MAKHMNEQDQFLKDLENDQDKSIDVLEQPLGPTGESSEKGEAKEVIGTTDKSEDDEEGTGLPLKPRNRRERRLMQKLQEERESSIFLAGKLEARSEAARVVSEESDYLKAVERIYGNDSPEAQLATDLLKKAIIGAKEDAKAAAIAEMRAERQREKDEAISANRELDSFIEDIEDTYGVTMSETHQRGFFQLLQKMSPKDRDGNVVGYADPHAVWEVFQEKIQKRTVPDNRAKNLSARSMVQSGASKESTLQDDSHMRFLTENGII
jgi:hypothetical protein